MPSTTPRALLVGVFAFASLLTLSGPPAHAQFPIFSGGTVLQPNGRKLGIPPGSPIRQSDYPMGTVGYQPWPPGNYPGGRYYNRRYSQVTRPRQVYQTPTYATTPRTYYVPGRGYYYYPQAVAPR